MLHCDICLMWNMKCEAKFAANYADGQPVLLCPADARYWEASSINRLKNESELVGDGETVLVKTNFYEVVGGGTVYETRKGKKWVRARVVKTNSGGQAMMVEYPSEVPTVNDADAPPIITSMHAYFRSEVVGIHD